MKSITKGVLILSIFVIVSAQEVIDYSALHDPTMPYKYTGTKAESKNSLELAMTFVSGKNKTAVINGDVYSIGDKIGGYIVRDIEQNKVVLDSVAGGSQKTLLTRRNLVIEKKTGKNITSSNKE